MSVPIWDIFPPPLYFKTRTKLNTATGGMAGQMEKMGICAFNQ